MQLQQYLLECLSFESGKSQEASNEIDQIRASLHNGYDGEELLQILEKLSVLTFADGLIGSFETLEAEADLFVQENLQA